jgi:glycosyltransferase involved in cell wall biosynthesis
MRVVHVIVGLEKGGAEMALRRLVEANIDLSDGVSPVVISLTKLGFHGAALRAQGFEVYALGLRGPLILFGGLFRLAVLLRRIKPCIVQTWMVHSDLLGGLAAKLAGVPHVIWGVRTTDYSVESRSTRAVRWLCSRLSSRIPDRVVCVAQASFIASAQAGYDIRKLTVIANGFDVAALRANVGAGATIRHQYGLREEHVVVGCLGRYNPAKDHANFVRAAALLAARYPACRFLMVGRELTPANAALAAKIKATGFADRFVLLGERSDPAACQDAMDVFVLSSCTEGFPNVLGEAMAMGLPCVSTDVGDAALLMGSREWLVPARDPKALADKLTQLLALSLEDRQRIGARARQRVVEEFSMSATAQQFFNLYTSLVAAKP